MKIPQILTLILLNRYSLFFNVLGVRQMNACNDARLIRLYKLF